MTSFALFQQSVTAKVIIGLKNATLGKVTRSRIEILVLFNICFPKDRGKDMKVLKISSHFTRKKR